MVEQVILDLMNKDSYFFVVLRDETGEYYVRGRSRGKDDTYNYNWLDKTFEAEESAPKIKRVSLGDIHISKSKKTITTKVRVFSNKDLHTLIHFLEPAIKTCQKESGLEDFALEIKT
jgi:hypothetical protein